MGRLHVWPEDQRLHGSQAANRHSQEGTGLSAKAPTTNVITAAALRHRAGLPPGQSINSRRHAVESFPTRSGRDSVYGGRRGTSYGPTGRIRMVASADTLALITAAAASDEEYSTLQQQIVNGWPDLPTHLPTALRPYAMFSDELSVSRGLVYKGHRLVVPVSHHIISYHLHLLRRHSPNVQQRRTTQHIQYYFKITTTKNTNTN